MFFFFLSSSLSKKEEENNPDFRLLSVSKTLQLEMIIQDNHESVRGGKKTYMTVGTGEKWRACPTSYIKGSMGALVIPRYAKFEEDEQTYQINKIAPYAFANTSVRTLIVPENLREIGKFAFANTKFMTFLNLSLTDIEEIPEGCFVNSSIRSIALPDTIYRVFSFAFNYSKLEIFKPMRNFAIIDPYGFCHCLNLTTVNLTESNMEKLDPKSFFECPNLKKLFISERSKVINPRTFADTDIPEIKIPKTLTELKEEAFARSGFVEFDFSESQIKVIPARTFIGCLRLEKVILGKQTTTVQRDAFAGSYVTEIIVYPALKTLEEGCFCNTSKLQELNLSVASVTVLPKGAFQNSFCGKLYLPNSLQRISENAFANGSIAQITFGEILSYIGKRAFFNCLKLYEVDLSKTHVKKIYDYTFYGCYSLSSIKLPVNVTKIGKGSFAQNKAKSIDFPMSLKELDEDAFAGCKNLAKVDLSLTQLNELNESVFANCTRLKDLILMPKIRGIREGALRNTGLKLFEFTESITHIGKYSFAECSELEKVSFEKSPIVSIPEGLFMNCTKLSVVIGLSEKGFQTISDYAFLGSKLNELKFCGQKVGIASFAFSKELVKVDLKSSYLSSLPDRVFYNCTKLTDLILSLSIIEIGSCPLYGTIIRSISLTESLTILKKGCFEGCSMIDNVDLSFTVIELLPSRAFYRCTSLKRLLFPKNLKKISYEAFALSGLERIVLPRNIERIGNFTFFGCPSLSFANLSLIRLKSLPCGMFYNCSSLHQIEFSRSVDAIGEQCFSGTNIYKLKFPPNSRLREFKKLSFYNCPNLKIVDLRNTQILFIGSYCFYGDTKLRQIKLLPDQIQEIGSFAFSRTGFRELTFPLSLTAIGKYAFYDCKDLINISLDSVEYVNISEGAFEGCTCLESIIMPQSIYSIGKSAFSKTALTTIQLPNTIAELRERSFAWCKDLRSLDLSQTQISSLSNECFIYCNRLKEITLPDMLTSIGTKCFACSALKSITLPMFVQVINESAFLECSKLKRANMLKCSLAKIPMYCFSECISLEEVTLPATLTEIGKAAFSGSGIKEILIPSSVTAIGNLTFVNCKQLVRADLSHSQIERMPYGLFYNCSILKECSLPPYMSELDVTCFKKCPKLRVIEYCGLNRPKKGVLKLPKVEVHVLMNYKSDDFFGKDIVRGYFCGSAPERTPKPTEEMWKLPPPPKTCSMSKLCLILLLSLSIISTYVLTANQVHKEMREQYTLLEQ